MTRRPPKLAAWLVSRLAAADTRAALLGDLEEEFASRVESAGLAAAKIWYWRQVRRSLFAMWAGRRDLAASDGPSSGIFSGLGRDLRYGTRALLAARRSTLVAVVILSLGIAASTTIFSVVDAVVLRGLPFPDPDQLVELATIGLKAGSHGPSSVAVPEFFDWYFAWEDFGRNSKFPNFTRNKVAVLTAGVEYYNLRQKFIFASAQR